MSVQAPTRADRRRADTAVVCPLCGSADAVPIFYGRPDADAAQLPESERVHLGGARPRTDAPDAHCRRCGYDWRCGEGLV